MSEFKTHAEWESYCTQELTELTPTLHALGITLEEKQPHIRGERYLMSGRKVVLLGSYRGTRAVIKASRDSRGKMEIAHEHESRTLLRTLPFAYRMFLMPQELWYGEQGGFRIAVFAYIEQEKPFLSRNLEEQCRLALGAFKTQESVHAATYAHTRTIRDRFGFWSAHTYLRRLLKFSGQIEADQSDNESLKTLLERVQQIFSKESDDVERYCGFLTHEDFALMNMRITDNDVYLIDLSSLRFGNKHESWARFLNFMLLYNRPLEQALLTYMRDNRSEEELRSLRLMRIYKTVELLAYHAKAMKNSTGNLHTLSQARIAFWTKALQSFVENTPLPDEVVDAYKHTRDSLRSPEEQERQKELQQL
jgi:predicted Ser/Thr protein kinase